MQIPFSKYHGTGNDFILIDNRKLHWKVTGEEIVSLCNRHFGIGADGLMLLSEQKGFDFHMTYYNSDGKESSMCGNGGRCMTIFARSLGLTGQEAKFSAIDGEHIARIHRKGNADIVKLKMRDVTVEEDEPGHLFMNTGSPHYVVISKDIEHLDIVTEARNIRYNDRFREEGTNVDFAEVTIDPIFVRSYERGVEDETLSCGTGVTASALAAAIRVPGRKAPLRVRTRGGELRVYYRQARNSFTDVWLEGEAVFVYSGTIMSK
jgi:diaminopimelate epimerase